ncbi:hypothetical protein H6F32_15880 [Anabaena sp. FACHB-1237]|uniref:hypothetical protein n=1 Tax=Anabaena sp. FACHB-1237 TaxID=2692769 RepID=UPI001680CA93|nr:hypothetical protein [Anabaena sp. FACHB-1237]MBD2139017.1 hypothetical protein [Anabaena sp. FACHB-1237]
MSQEYQIVEKIVNESSLATVLEMLERISHKQAQYWREHEKDEHTAKLWDKAAKQIEQINVEI